MNFFNLVIDNNNDLIRKKAKFINLIKKSARAVLKIAYQKHNTPNQQQKQELALKTNLSVVQVSNWFKNQRQRARQYMR